MTYIQKQNSRKNYGYIVGEITVMTKKGRRIRMALSKGEKETIISFNEAEDIANVYSCSRSWWKRLERLGSKPVRIEKYDDGSIDGKEYECPKTWIKVQKPRKLNLSDEQREKLRQRMANIKNKVEL